MMEGLFFYIVFYLFAFSITDLERYPIKLVMVGMGGVYVHSYFIDNLLL